jgi:hypothetical protein
MQLPAVSKILVFAMAAAGAVFGGLAGLAASMWGSLPITYPLCIVMGQGAGYALGKGVVSFWRIFVNKEGN